MQAIHAAAFALLAASLPRAAAAIDTTAPPPARQVHEWLEGDWAHACGKLRAALVGTYSPQACESDAYAAWLDIQRWFDLIARNEYDETARLAARHLRWHGTDRRVVVFPTGILPPTDNLEPIPNATLQQLVRDPRFAESALPAIAPAGFRPEDRPLGKRIDPARLRELLADAPLSREFFQALREEDFPPAAIEILARCRDAGPALFGEYLRLAVAIAIVRDQPAPPNWPHHQVKPEAVPRVNRPPHEIFGFWIQCQQLGRLYLDIRTLEVEQIKHIVDAPVRESEFLWAQAQVDVPRYRFAEAFDIVRYDHARIRSGQFAWPGGDYSMRSIRAAGGICTDQAYFATLAGKAKGMPTLLFSGQGPNGGHAWFGFMKRDDTWLLDCGRERNRGQPTGTALDPQTWLPISDHDLRFLAAGFRDTPPYRIARRHIAVARLFAQAGDGTRQLAALRNAIAACPQDTEAWDAVAALLRAARDTPALRQHATDAIAQFQTDPETRVRYQRLLADIAREAGLLQEAERITDDIIQENRAGRSDLSAKAAWQPIQQRLDAGDTNAAFTAYRDTLGHLSRHGGGNLYFQVVVPFALALQERGNPQLAEEALLLARQTLRPKPLSPLDAHMAKLQKHLRGESP